VMIITLYDHCGSSDGRLISPTHTHRDPQMPNSRTHAARNQEITPKLNGCL
jgi:hypothetical protein